MMSNYDDGDIGSNEINETNENTDNSENEMDSELSDSLDTTYESKLEQGNWSKETIENKDVEEDDPITESKDSSEDFEEELDNNYQDYLDENKTVNIEKSESFESKWSEDINSRIDNKEQFEIYKNADLHEAEINGRKCLVKDIDFDYVDEKTGKTNRELMAKGRSPIDSKTGERIELHHMGQSFDSPFAELDENSEHGDGNQKTLHPKTEDSWRNDKELVNQYNKEKAEHWKTRSKEG